MVENPENGLQEILPENVEILVVEDSPTQALNLKMLLQTKGYGVSVCHNGQSALEFLRKRKPTLVISDVVMPIMDGYELCKTMKEDRALADIPVILVTALSEPSEIIRALESGAASFITKPFDEQFLISRIQYILQNMAIRRQPSMESGLEIFFAGKRYRLAVEPTQIVDLLFSSYETAVKHRRRLEEVNKSLVEANQKLRDLTRELHELSLKDPLTGLNNRRGFFLMAEQQIEISRRNKRPFVLFYFDIDEFKNINDLLGHKEGDKVLVDTAGVLKETFRSSDIVARLARIGGDEFVVLAIDASESDAASIIDRLERNIAAYNKKKSLKYQLSLSVGIAAYHPDLSLSVDDLMAIADQNMYHYKRDKKTRLSRD